MAEKALSAEPKEILPKRKKICKKSKKGVDKREGAWYDSKAVSERAQRPALDSYKNRNLLLTNFGECAKIKFRSQERKRTLKIKQH